MQDLTIWQAFVLGALQGLTEFLPVSSSAHLSLTPWAFGWEPAGLGFDLALHVGTLVALLFYFRAEWVMLIGGGFTLLRRGRAVDDPSRRALFIIIATIPAAVAGLFLEEYAETIFRAPVVTGIALIVMGALLWIVDATARRDRARETMTWRDAVLVGIAQCFALVPGVSRSGATITAGRALGFDRASAAVFSFLMSMPIILGAAIFKVPDALAESGITLPLVVGVVTAALSSALAINLLLRYVSRRGYGVFAVYRFILGAIVLAMVAMRAGP
jgi:undecaprenyl-diphosphatase